MAIDPDQIGQFTEDGSQSLSELGLDFACRHCHNENGMASPKSDAELQEAARGIHDEPATSATSTTSLAIVDSVVVEEREGQYYAIIQGNFPDSCTTTSEITQSVDGNIFDITMTTTSPPGAICAQMLAPFTEEVLLETEGLEPGEYVVDVNNGMATTTFVIS
jgi:hypothetical protein